MTSWLSTWKTTPHFCLRGPTELAPPMVLYSNMPLFFIKPTKKPTHLKEMINKSWLIWKKESHCLGRREKIGAHVFLSFFPLMWISVRANRCNNFLCHKRIIFSVLINPKRWGTKSDTVISIYLIRTTAQVASGTKVPQFISRLCQTVTPNWLWCSQFIKLRDSVVW